VSEERRPYQARSAEFKAEAVRMVEKGERQTEVARKLGISPSLLATWIANSRGKERPKKEQNGESERNRVLERELKKTRMELDILKKAVAFFARENP
jgi:transposase